ncbi:DegT/DnrJ/EryC1/StrS family aminotransferase [Sporosarcina sp. BI001-red]|uniref:DegT/DnrJ/EryC1/StrS family aminotransferase n=1 Tax=Sporosarcina sp. BI001-red TaxID=2282866 RepID=UPI000E235F22|nr:DegT/DnrJ/EryC1/StrS family aminotransferase [Sporosarcina sp. BI001-red]REB08730.1 DegT/DnrJ/EryC1/StrS family aminotransferase [Sporosarcina sp. BI001-red]
MVESFEEPIFVTRPLLPDMQDITQKMTEIWASQWVTNNGRQQNDLQEKLLDYVQAENLTLFTNGTMALLLGLKSLGLTGEVITTPFTFPATVQALDWNGLTPVFCDIEPETLTIDVSKIEALITEKTSAILGVHVFGNPCNVQEIQRIADKYGLKVIYDGAHAFGSEIDSQPAGSHGDMTMYSFHATKLFHTIEGGALVFKDPQLAPVLDQLKNFGLAGKEEVVLSGLNAKMNEIQAAVGLETLKLLDIEREKRHRVKRIYEEQLADVPGIRAVTHLEGKDSSYQYFVIEVDEHKFGRTRDWLHDHLEQHNVFSRKYFYPLCSDFQWYKTLKSVQPTNLPQAQKTVKEVLAMPYYGELETASVIQICTLIKRCHVVAAGAAL